MPVYRTEDERTVRTVPDVRPFNLVGIVWRGMVLPGAGTVRVHHDTKRMLQNPGIGADVRLREKSRRLCDVRFHRGGGRLRIERSQPSTVAQVHRSA